VYIFTASAHIEPGASSIFEVRRKMQPVDLGMTINLKAVINKVYVFPLPAAFMLYASLLHPEFPQVSDYIFGFHHLLFRVRLNPTPFG